MTRFFSAMGCCVVILAMTADRAVAAPEPAASQSEPQAEEPEQAAEKPEQAAEEPEQAAEKPEPAAEKPEQAAAKPEQAAAKPEAAAPESQPAAAEPKPKAAPQAPAAQKPSTHTVKPELLKIEVSLKGSFEPQSLSEIVLRPEVWSTFKVLKAVEHGEEVRRGDLLVEFEMEDVDKAIADQRAKVELAELVVKQVEEVYRILEATTPLDLASAERRKREDDEDLARFLKIDRPTSEKVANFNFETSQNYLEYQLEELRQLEKMYKADDLTEETEEIVLKRQRDAVKRAEFYLELDKLRRDETLGLSLPRQEESMKQSNRREELLLDQTKATLPLALRRNKLELDKLNVQLAKDQEQLKEIEADRAMMTVKAPTDGIVYYGRFNRGEWSGASSGAEKLRAGGSVTAKEVFMTIVKPRPMSIRVEVAEKYLHQFRTGLKGEVRPTGYPDLRLAAAVTRIDAIPFSDGTFEALLRVNVGEGAEALMPGMGCTVKFVPYLKTRALTVPASAVHTDEIDDQKHFVCLVTEDGKQRKQSVTLGKKADDKIEILDGLVAGDQVAKEFPKDKR